MYRFLASLALLVSAATASAQKAPDCATSTGKDRVALVIGNSDYSKGNWQSLRNARNDALTLCDSLAKAGFGIELVTDADAAAMRAALTRFAARAQGADTAIVYFAGHGFEYLGTGYLVPVDGPAPPAVPAAEMVARFVPLDEFALAAGRAKTHQFVFLDACRAPVEIADGGSSTQAFRTISKDLPPDFDWSGILVYSTSRDRYAYDYAPTDDAKNSPFAASIAGRMLQPGMGFASFLRAVKDEVEEQTRGMSRGPQHPTAWGIPGNDFEFVAAGTRDLAAMQPASSPQAMFATEAAQPRQIEPFDGLTTDKLAIIDEPMLIARLMRSHTPEEMIAYANKGDPVAQYLVGYMFHFGDNLPKNLGLARTWLEAAAASGHPAGQTELAYFLVRNAQLGDAGAADRARARDLYEKAAAQGFAKAQSHLGFALSYGTVAPVDKVRALSLFTAAAKAGHVYANFALATTQGGDPVAGEARLREIVKGGNPEGNLWLCELYHAQKRDGGANSECLDAAERGYAGARAITAMLYDRGLGVTRTPDSAEYWARLALKTPDLEYGYRAQMLSLLSGMGLKP